MTDPVLPLAAAAEAAGVDYATARAAALAWFPEHLDLYRGTLTVAGLDSLVEHLAQHRSRHLERALNEVRRWSSTPLAIRDPRNQAIAIAREVGATIRQLVELTGLTRGQVHNVLRQLRDAPSSSGEHGPSTWEDDRDGGGAGGTRTDRVPPA